MRKIKGFTTIVVVLSILVLLAACPDYNNPVDPEADDYQGFATVATVYEVVPAVESGNSITFLEMYVSKCLEGDRYRLQVNSISGDYSSPLYDTDQSSNLFDFSSAITDLGTYYCRTTARNTDGIWGSWSSEISFIVRVDLGSIVPEDGGETSDNFALLEWDDVDGAVSYEVRYADSSAGLASAPVNEVLKSEYKIAVEQSTGSTIYWQVRGTNEAGIITVWSEITSFWISPAIGDSYGGGIVFYLDGNGGGLVAAENDLGTSSVWGGYGTSVGGTSSAIGTGAANTAAIVAAFGSAEPYEGRSDYAAKVCADLVLNGYDDWFLPSKDELNLMYKNRDAIGGFSALSYWSSSEYASDYAWLQFFDVGRQSNYIKSDDDRVRPVRAF